MPEGLGPNVPRDCEGDPPAWPALVTLAIELLPAAAELEVVVLAVVLGGAVVDLIGVVLMDVVGGVVVVLVGVVLIDVLAPPPIMLPDLEVEVLVAEVLEADAPDRLAPAMPVVALLDAVPTADKADETLLLAPLGIDVDLAPVVVLDAVGFVLDVELPPAVPAITVGRCEELDVELVGRVVLLVVVFGDSENVPVLPPTMMVPAVPVALLELLEEALVMTTRVVPLPVKLTVPFCLAEVRLELALAGVVAAAAVVAAVFPVLARALGGKVTTGTVKLGSAVLMVGNPAVPVPVGVVAELGAGAGGAVVAGTGTGVAGTALLDTTVAEGRVVDVGTAMMLVPVPPTTANLPE